MEPTDGNESDASVDSADAPQGVRAPRLSVEVGMVSSVFHAPRMPTSGEAVTMLTR
jgi:hypothetical protein